MVSNTGHLDKNLAVGVYLKDPLLINKTINFPLKYKNHSDLFKITKSFNWRV